MTDHYSFVAGNSDSRLLTNSLTANRHLNKMLHFPPIYFFAQQKSTENAFEPLQTLASQRSSESYQKLPFGNFLRYIRRGAPRRSDMSIENGIFKSTAPRMKIRNL